MRQTPSLMVSKESLILREHRNQTLDSKVCQQLTPRLLRNTMSSRTSWTEVSRYSRKEKISMVRSRTLLRKISPKFLVMTSLWTSRKFLNLLCYLPPLESNRHLFFSHQMRSTTLNKLEGKPATSIVSPLRICYLTTPPSSQPWMLT